MKTYKLLTVCALMLLMACGNDSSSANSVDPGSSSSEESLGNSSSSNSQKSEPLADPLQFFETRGPKKDAYTCDWYGSKIVFAQKDWICSFKYADMDGFVYVQGTPTGCNIIMSPMPVISVDTAVLYVKGKYETLSDVTYDWGGNHHFDSFRFSYDGKVYEYGRSTISSITIHPCHEIDCLKVYESDGETLVLDGCGLDEDDISKARQLPVVCRFADEETGSFGDFTDTFEFCPDDSRLMGLAE